MSVRWAVGPSVGPSVTLLFFGLLGAKNAVYTAPLLVFFLLEVSQTQWDHERSKDRKGFFPKNIQSREDISAEFLRLARIV